MTGQRATIRTLPRHSERVKFFSRTGDRIYVETVFA